MTREQFEHAVRAAAAVLDVREVLVIGSQAIHGSVRDPLPHEALRSIEVDVSALDDPDGSRADLVDGSIGEASMFHRTFGYYAQGALGRRDRTCRRLRRRPIVCWPHRLVAGRKRSLSGHILHTPGRT
jgi:hypothetical protein